MLRLFFLVVLISSSFLLQAQVLGSSIDQVASFDVWRVRAAYKDLGRYANMLFDQQLKEHPEWKEDCLKISDKEYELLSAVVDFFLSNERVDSTELLDKDTVVKVMFNDRRMAAFERAAKEYKALLLKTMEEWEKKISMKTVVKDSFLAEQLEECLPFQQFPNRDYFRKLNLAEARILLESMLLGVRQMKLVFIKRFELEENSHQNDNPLKIEKQGAITLGQPCTLVFSLDMINPPANFKVKLSNGKQVKSKDGKAIYSFTPPKAGRVQLEASVELLIDGTLRSFKQNCICVVLE